ncbi:MAG TPA: exo-poly-alpha-D-galacturonosidase [Sphingobacteriaceae bacterium]|nr:exo-poly-alpha-D-galacturonosidase [Sphingobacteriaceae bacterium]
MLKKIFITLLLAIANLYPVFAQPNNRAAQSAGTQVLFNVRAYGAVGDGKNLDSPFINKAIDACAQAGGGTVLLPAGTYLSGSIRLKSNINLLIDAGATILGAPQEMNAYDSSEPFPNPPAFQDGGHTYFHNSLIWGENLVNVSITGQGLINGGGLLTNDGPQDRIDGFSNFGRATPQPPSTVDISTVRVGNKAIALKLCRNVIMRDFTIIHGGHFAILVTGCDGMTVDNVTMDTNRDGIDIDACRNTVVSNCRINSPNDDGLCLKSSFALGRNVICENITITNCQVFGFYEGTLLDGTMKQKPDGQGRIKFGTEANGGYRNITISNCVFRGCRGLALEEVDGGIMENITIDNISMMDVQSYAIYVTTGRRNRGPNITAKSTARNIMISNVVATGVDRRSGIILQGMDDQPIEGLRLENIRLVFNGGGTKEDAAIVAPELNKAYPEPRGTLPASGIFARHIKDLELANVRFSYDLNDMRPPMIFSDINGLEIDNLKTPVSAGVSAATFENVRGMVVRNSPVLDQVVSAENSKNGKSAKSKK